MTPGSQTPESSALCSLLLTSYLERGRQELVTQLIESELRFTQGWQETQMRQPRVGDQEWWGRGPLLSPPTQAQLMMLHQKQAQCSPVFFLSFKYLLIRLHWVLVAMQVVFVMVHGL